jgi:hypothetical protein
MMDAENREATTEAADAIAQYVRQRNLAGEDGKATVAQAAANFKRQSARR